MSYGKVWADQLMADICSPGLYRRYVVWDLAWLWYGWKISLWSGVNIIIVLLNYCSCIYDHCIMAIIVLDMLLEFNNNDNKRPLTPKSMPPAGDEHTKLET